MYAPRHFQETRRTVLIDAIRASGLGTLTTLNGGRLVASHLPFVLDAEAGAQGVLYGHLARANPQWQDYDPSVPALASFVLADAYVSPSWYPSKAENGKVVPTWNYVAVQASGPLTLVEDPETLRKLVDRLTEKHEADRARPWSVDDAPADFTAAMLRGIVGLRIEIAGLTGAWKLSQNRTTADRQGVLHGLQGEGPQAAPVAEAVETLMRDREAP